jgi:hypothetical protein
MSNNHFRLARKSRKKSIESLETSIVILKLKIKRYKSFIFEKDIGK